jgi:hypothetical protein
MNDFWNERYASKDYVYGKEPNQPDVSHLKSNDLLLLKTS